MEKTFLKPAKQVKQEIGKKFLHTAVSGGSFLIGKGICNLTASKINNENIKKTVGPGMYLIGTIAESFIDNPNIAAIGRGLAISGINKIAEDFIPSETQQKMYLTPVAGMGYANNSSKSFDWEAASKLAEAEMKQGMGIDDGHGNQATKRPWWDRWHMQGMGIDDGHGNQATKRPWWDRWHMQGMSNDDSEESFIYASAMM